MAGKFGNLETTTPAEIRQFKGLCTAICGDANVGKTTLLRTLFDSSRIKKVLVADMEGGAHVLPTVEGLEVIVVDTFAKMKALGDELKRQPKYYDAVAFDTLSEAQGIDLKGRGLYGAEDRMRMRIYGDSHMDMTDFTRDMRDLSRKHGLHVIFSLWTDTFVNQDTGVKSTTLYLTNKYEAYFRGIVDYIGLLKYGDPPNIYPPVLTFMPSASLPTKYRVAPDEDNMKDLPKIHHNPSLGHIIDTFFGDPFPTDKHKAGAKP